MKFLNYLSVSLNSFNKNYDELLTRMIRQKQTRLITNHNILKINNINNNNYGNLTIKKKLFYKCEVEHYKIEA